MGDPRQCWIGNVPAELNEPELIELLGLHGVRPFKIVLRQRSGQDPLVNMHMNKS